MIEIKTKDNEQDYRYVRIEVFMKEQGFQNEFDEIDATAVHITVYVDGTLAGCARCFPKEEEAAWVFGRISPVSPSGTGRCPAIRDGEHRSQQKGKALYSGCTMPCLCVL